MSDITNSKCKKELKDKDLEKVDGGSVYSDETFWGLGYNYIAQGQEGNYHPLIVFFLNSCKLCTGTTCYSCGNSFKKGLTFYCSIRSQENDPCKK